MRQVPIRELNQHTADVIARVEAGERIEITRNGTKVAVISPSSPHPLSALIESGELRPAPSRNEINGLLQAIVTEDPHESSSGLDALLEDRYGTERW
jgi:prevent-host-death family protein